MRNRPSASVRPVGRFRKWRKRCSSGRTRKAERKIVRGLAVGLHDPAGILLAAFDLDGLEWRLVAERAAAIRSASE